MMRVRIVSREGKYEPTLKTFNVVYPMDMSSKKKSFDLYGAFKVKEFFELNVQHILLISFIVGNNSQVSNKEKTIGNIDATITRRLTMTKS